MSKATAAAVMKRNPSMYGRLTAIVRKEDGPGVGMDFEVTRLRSLDYTRFWALNHKRPDGSRALYLCATTPDLMIEEITGGRGHNYRGPVQNTALWDAGAYTVYVPVQDILDTKSTGIHVIPERRPYAINRHPHHGVAGSGYHTPDSLSGHFLDVKVHTCWSEFGSPVMSAIGEANVVELFRYMRIFAGRYYAGSPLRSMGRNDMDFIKKVS